VYKSGIQVYEEQKIFDELDFLSSSAEPRKEKAQAESIEVCVKMAQSANWKDRVRSFRMIQKCEEQLQDSSD
jgi:hypothetical protein